MCEQTCSGAQADSRFGIVLDFVQKLHNGSIKEEEAKRFLRREDPFNKPEPKKVEATGEVIVRNVKVDRTRIPKEVMDATKRVQYVNKDVLATLPTGEGDEVDVWFVPTKRYVPVAEVDAFLAQYGLVPDPRAQAAVNENDPAFADKCPNGTQWGNNCYLAFYRWGVERCVLCFRIDNDWDDSWFLSGVPSSRK